jgi:two-component system, NarL family, sensor histidine kinase UhpB
VAKRSRHTPATLARQPFFLGGLDRPVHHLRMSLRLRVVIAVLLVLALGSGLGLALAGLSARSWLREELSGAQGSGRLTVERAFGDLPHTDDRDRELAALIYSFDGDRHQRAMLLAPNGDVLVASFPSPAAAPPDWFSDMLRQSISPLRLHVPGPGGETVDLVPVYANDLAAVWAEFLDLAMVLLLASVGGAVVVFVVVGQALGPLRSVGRALPRIGAGDYAVRAPEQGPPELAALGRGVNEMAQRLGAMRDRTRALEEQILTLQDEERADIARDLHDEIGPQLFAANVDAAMTANLISAGRPEAALEQVRAVTTSIAHIQRLVRDILGRLRPTQLTELGLASAVQDLVDFWHVRRPELAFETKLPDGDGAFSDQVQEIIYRIVQESLSNAVRHGAPRRIRIEIARDEDAARVEVTNDGVGGAAHAPGYGLTGMSERVAAAGGSMSAGPTEGGGWRVAARLPLDADSREEAA